ncbi:MAG TPA: hypothetical protein VMT98_19560 [Verrucomicrobiae bacterium]|nr:hypothetical protein [Verrucomicrobiae bacterium]
MDPTCPHCGGNAFKVFSGAHGDILGTCVKCRTTRSLRASEVAGARQSSQDNYRDFWAMAR